VTEALDPGNPRTLDDFITALRGLKIAAGNPSITRITRSVAQAWHAAGRPDSELPARATVGYCFRPGRARPNPDLLLAIVAVLVGDDADRIDRWTQALRLVLGETEAAYQVSAGDLPADLADFTGRAGLLDRPDELTVISAFGGMAGIGKTALAVHLAHRYLDAGRADRVLFVNLRGYDPDSPPAAPAAVLESFLRRLGIAGERIPPALDGRAALYREVVAGTRTLVVLDNAASAAQVTPLLPGTPTCPVLVTSRAALADLPGAGHVQLPPFTTTESLDLLRRIAGPDRVDADPAAATTIAGLLGHLPLALAVIGSHLRDHPEWALSDYPPALTGLAMEGGVRAALAMSDGSLADGPRRLLRLLALHPGADIEPHAATALAGAPAEADLAALTSANLLQAGRGRYGFHDLTRAYATERGGLDHPRRELQAARDRLLDHYARTSSVAMDAAYAYERLRRPEPPPAPAGPDLAGPDLAGPDLAGPEAAEAWLDAELDNLLAAAATAPEHGRPDHTIHQSATLHRHLRARGRYAAAVDLHERVLRLTGPRDTPHERTLSLLGDVHYLRGRLAEAADCYRRALAVAAEIGDRAGEQNARNGLGAVHYLQGDYERSAESYQRALRLARDLGDRAAEQQALNGLGWVHHVQGRRGLALDFYAQGLAIARATGNRNGAENALNGMAGIYQAEGRHAEAADAYDEVLASAAATGNQIGQQNALTGIGHSMLALGDYGAAADRFGQVLRIARDTGNRASEAQALIGLGHASYRQGQHTEAVARYAQVLVIAADIGYPNAAFEAHEALGRCHAAVGDYAAAAGEHEQARVLAVDLGQPDDEARALDGLAQAAAGQGHAEAALGYWRSALEVLTGAGLETTYDPEVNSSAIRRHLAE
jgi:tetratricopeptide (TPR) repeat protein